MDTTPYFSICIPTIGRLDLIKIALESLKRQTDQDFEVIIGDSHRNTELEHFVQELHNPAIRVVHPPPKAGAFSPWDHPPRFARGRYVMWLDDDNALLPDALALFRKIAERTQADIITANHLYFYDAKHPRRELRHSIGIVPFTGKEYAINLENALRQTFSFSRSSLGATPRFHFSATIVSRAVVQKAYGRLGHVLFPDLPHMHSLTPILFSFAHTCVFLDRPVAIIGRLSVSMSQSWSTAARKRFKDHTTRGLSPLAAYTKINARYESYLRVRAALPEVFKDIPIDEVQFAEIHLRELSVLDAPLLQTTNYWIEFFHFIRRFSEPTYSRLHKTAFRYALRAPLVYISRRVRLHYLRRVFVALQHHATHEAIQSWNREFTLPLPRNKKYQTTAEVAQDAKVLLRELTGHTIADAQ